MAINGGQIIHTAGQFVIDRIQSAGPGDLSIPETKIKELGNYESVATVRDKPELQFNLETLDMTAEIEALLLGKEDPSTFPTTVGSNEIDLNKSVPVDIMSLWKSKRGQFNIVKGVIMPFLSIDSATYRFAVGDNGTKSYTLSGDSIFYVPAVPKIKSFTLTSATTYTIPDTAIFYKPGGANIYITSAILINDTDGSHRRLSYEGASPGTSGYDCTATSITIGGNMSTDYDRLQVTYGTLQATSYTQDGNDPYGHQVHEPNLAVKPAAIRSKDIEIYIGNNDPTPVFTKLTGVQSFEVTWSVTREKDEELGNDQAVANDYDVPEVSGSIELKAFDPADFFDKLAMFTGIPNTEIIGPNITVPLPVEARIKHPDTGARLATYYIPDARFQVPGYNGQVDAKQSSTISYSSEGGKLLQYNGSRV